MCLDYGRLSSGLMWGGPVECWGYMGGQGGGSLATGRGVQGLQCFLGLLGRQVQTSGARAGTFWYILFSTCYD